MHLHDVIEYRIEIWTQTFLNIRHTDTLVFNDVSEYIFAIAPT